MRKTNSQEIHDVANFLAFSTDEELAEVFVRWKKLNENDRLTSEQINLKAEDMLNFDSKKFGKFVGDVLDEIIDSDDIDSSAWWKQKKALTEEVKQPKLSYKMPKQKELNRHSRM